MEGLWELRGLSCATLDSVCVSVCVHRLVHALTECTYAAVGRSCLG